MRQVLLIGILFAAAVHVQAQVPPVEHQIAAAVTPAPPALQEGAAVLGYAEPGSPLVVLREGSNEMVCIADDPTDERFHVACYHRSLDPFMARGRQLRAEGKSRDELQEIRLAEIEAGTLPMPAQAAALYSLTGGADAFDASTGTAEKASRLTVVYMPGATAESTGLPTSAPAGSPWLMNAGTPWAHIMLIEAAPEE
jgi:hypothetical protein